jgi:hypothetical protein
MIRLTRAIRLAALAALLALGGVACAADKPTSAPAPESAPTTSTAPDTAELLADMGIPPTPDPKTWKAYIADLTAIDPAIVHGKEEKVVDRGRNMCSSVKETPDDQAKLVKLTNQRFTSPDHPDGFGDAKAKKILAAVRKHICPTY